MIKCTQCKKYIEYECIDETPLIYYGCPNCKHTISSSMYVEKNTNINI